jgi:hypothetical protein
VESFLEARGLARLLYETTYGIHDRQAESQKRAAEARLAARYELSKAHLPIAPDYKPE